MARAESIRKLEAAIGDENETFLSELELAELTSAALPDNVMLSVGTEKNGTVEIEWEGHFAKQNGELQAHCESLWTRKYWDAPLGMPFYMDLMKRAVETRAKTHGDVEFENWEDDGAFIQLSYKFTKLPENLRDAYKEVMHRNKWLSEAADALSEKVGALAAEAAQKASGWGETPTEELVNTVENAESTDDKGRSLEELIARLFAETQGFTVSGRVRTETEEIDITITNSNTDPRFQREEALILDSAEEGK